MQKKTIKKVVKNKMLSWLSTITDKHLREDVKENILVSGGAIASMFLNEDVNDFDVYIKDMDVLKRLAVYYASPFKIEIFDGREKESLLEEYNEFNSNNSRAICIKTLHEDQIKLNVSEGFRVDQTKATLNPEGFNPAFFSPNAISLSDDLQIVCRFHGDSTQIHKTFDFMHATNYFTFEEGLVTNLAAMESLMTKQLKYQGSLYPLTSIIRSRKFIKRGWNIGAGEYLKIMFQISELDLHDPEVLEEQLIGVDVAYFSALIAILRDKFEKDKGFTITNEYLRGLIEKVFEDSDEEN